MPFIEEIQELTRSIWDSILQLPIDMEEAPIADGQVIAAYVHITGAWQGTVSLTCGTDMAGEAAAIMFDVASPDSIAGDMQDAMGELVNMIGGNIKGLLPEICKLSTPTVVQGHNCKLHIPGSRVVANVGFKCGAHGLNVKLLQRDAA
jgi:chemotaxis protein CheX